MAIDKRIPIYRFVVGEDDDAGVTAVALVDNPAIEMNWQAFAASKISFDFDDTLSTARGQELAQQLIDKGAIIYVISARQDVQGMLKTAKDLGIPESRVFATGSNKAKIEKVKSLGITKHYDNNADVIKELGSIGSKFVIENQFIVEPKDNESEDEFINRCIAVEVGNGYDQEQAAAMCYSKWDKQKFAETYNDYPKKASENAQAALNYAEKNGWGSCGTDVGKQRANQLAKGENISRETIARMAAFERHRQNSQKELGDGCGRLMWLAWGGDEGIEWAQRKLKQIDQKMSKFSSNKEKKIISGALMVADLPIYRKDEQGEYYGLFTAEDIYNIRNKFFKNNNPKSVNEMHDPNKMIEGVYMIESFIIDSKRGINAPDGLKLTDGSWFGSYKVDNEEIWNDFIKTGEFKGFSVEGVFKTTKIDAKPLSIIEQAIDIIKQIED